MASKNLTIKAKRQPDRTSLLGWRIAKIFKKKKKKKKASQCQQQHRNNIFVLENLILGYQYNIQNNSFIKIWIFKSWQWKNMSRDKIGHEQGILLTVKHWNILHSIESLNSNKSTYLLQLISILKITKK